jgi:hypothetical protein
LHVGFPMRRGVSSVGVDLNPFYSILAEAARYPARLYEQKIILAARHPGRFILLALGKAAILASWLLQGR